MQFRTRGVESFLGRMKADVGVGHESRDDGPTPFIVASFRVGQLVGSTTSILVHAATSSIAMRLPACPVTGLKIGPMRRVPWVMTPGAPGTLTASGTLTAGGTIVHASLLPR
jgi:hypothetical protein